MAASKKLMKGDWNFEIGLFGVKDYTGSGEVQEIYRTPSSVANANSAFNAKRIGPDFYGYAQFYYTLKATGRLSEFGIEDDIADDMEACVEHIADHYVVDIVACDANGKPKVDKENPTRAN